MKVANILRSTKLETIFTPTKVAKLTYIFSFAFKLDSDKLQVTLMWRSSSVLR